MLHIVFTVWHDFFPALRVGASFFEQFYLFFNGVNVLDDFSRRKKNRFCVLGFVLQIMMIFVPSWIIWIFQAKQIFFFVRVTWKKKTTQTYNNSDCSLNMSNSCLLCHLTCALHSLSLQAHSATFSWFSLRITKDRNTYIKKSVHRQGRK